MKLTKENAQEKLLEFRHSHKITQDKLQEKTGVSRPTLTGIENGTLTPQAMTLYKLNKYIETVPDNEKG